LRKFLPQTDFAYTVEDLQGEDEITRARGLAFNRNTKDLLIANRLVREDECIGVLVLDKPYKGAELLDKKYGKPEPLFTPEKLAELRAKEAAAWAEHVRNPKPVRAPNLARSLALLKVRKRNDATS